MTLWQLVLAASIIVLALKLAGFLVPAAILARPRADRVANLLTIALLSALVAVQTFGAPCAVVLDARLPALIVAAALFAARLPFVVVVLAAAATAGLLRAVT